MTKSKQTLTIGGVRLTPAALVVLILAVALLAALQHCNTLPADLLGSPTAATPMQPVIDATIVPPTATALPLEPSATARHATPTPDDGLETITLDALTSEARDVLALIARGGPFPYRQDGAVFQNREGLLPAQPRGYYHEYTVDTPGSSDRGARRIVTGEQGEIYYTDDHYASFRRVIP